MEERSQRRADDVADNPRSNPGPASGGRGEPSKSNPNQMAANSDRMAAEQQDLYSSVLDDPDGDDRETSRSDEEEISFHPRHHKGLTNTSPSSKPSKDEQRAVAAFKVPPFEADRAEKFFFLCEDRFTSIGIYDHNLRASCIMEYLPSNLVEMLTQRFAEFAKSKDRYASLKQAILDYTQRPIWARMQAIHNLPNVGHLSPTQIMCRILTLKSSHEPFYEMLQFEFLRRLPTPLFDKFKSKRWGDPMSFAIKVESEWARNSSLANSVPDAVPVSRPSDESASAPAKPETIGSLQPTPNGDMESTNSSELAQTLQPLVAVLQRVVSRGQTANRRTFRGQRGGFRGYDPYLSRGRGRGFVQPYQGPYNQLQDQRSSRQEWCFYHQRFGSAAWSCKQPCSYNRRMPGSFENNS